MRWHRNGIRSCVLLSPASERFAAHGYGPAILAGAEIIELLNNYSFYINDSALQLKEKNK